MRRILALAGHDLRPGLPPPGGAVVVWGRRAVAARGERVAAWRGAGLLRVEDAFLRSVLPGRAGTPTLGLMLDARGVHFDASAPSEIEHLLANAPTEDAALLARARAGIARLRRAHFSKYCALDPDLEPPAPGYVLVIDQTRGDASIRHGAADAGSFARMLAAARADYPDSPILIRSHPETAQGFRPGHFGTADTDARTRLCSAPHSPWRLFEGARAVYAVSSLMSFEAVLAGHRPVLFGQPFHAGWGLTEDRAGAPARRGRPLSPEQLFAAAYLQAPLWYDPFRDRLTDFETVADILEAQARAWREDRRGHVATGMRLWKRAHLARAFGQGGRRLVFEARPVRAVARASASGRGVLVWAGQETEALACDAAAKGVPLARVEDGFLRSRGLGAELVPPLSLVADDLGIYYDPGRESRLERLIAASPMLDPAELVRAEWLIAALHAQGVTKYNLGGTAPGLPRDRRVVLVPGQVEDDASIRLGAGEVRSNLALLEVARAGEPDAFLVYKPHPDVEAGLRPGALPEGAAERLADLVARRADPAALMARADAVWTMTSLLGFEALLRGVPVTCLGVPFYAGWGLTRDLGPVPGRRREVTGVTRAGLAHAALIAYPRYTDPLTGLACPAEVAVARLAAGPVPRPGPILRLLAKAQGLFAGRAALWR